MVIAYFETPNNSYSEIAAIFADENIYIRCLPILQREAKKSRMIVTESCDLSIEDVREALK